MRNLIGSHDRLNSLLINGVRLADPKKPGLPTTVLPNLRHYPDDSMAS